MKEAVMTGTAIREVKILKAHLAINVRNLEKSAEFYRKLFGIGPSKVRPGYAKFDVIDPPLNFTLNLVPFLSAGALSHMGIQVASTEDVLAVRERWLAARLEVRDENSTECCYALQNKSWVKDPDGNEWEVFVVLQDNLPEKAGAQSQSQCCAPESVKQPEEKGTCCVPGSSCCTPDCAVS